MDHEHDLVGTDHPSDSGEPLVRPLAPGEADDSQPQVETESWSENADSRSVYDQTPESAEMEPPPAVTDHPDELSTPVESPPETSARPADGVPSMIPRHRQRSRPESFFVRLVATAGIVGICVAIAAIMVSSHSQGWIVGLVTSVVSCVLAAILWSSRVL